MDEEQKNLLIIGIIAIALVMAMFFAYSKGKTKEDPNAWKTSKSEQPKLNIAKTSTKDTNSTKPESEYHQDSSSYTSGSSFSTSRYPSRVGNSGPLVKMDKKKLESMKKFRENAKTQQQDIIKAKIQKILNDPNADPSLAAHCQVISSEAYRNATVARKNKEFKTAIKNYHKMLKDKKATPVMQYFALDGIKRCSQETGDLQLYILAIKQMGELLSKEDLSVINEEKNDSYLRWATKFEKYMMAKRDSTFMQQLMDEHMNRYKRSRDEAEKKIKAEIAKLESFYKEFAN